MLNLETLPNDVLVLILRWTYHLTALSHVSKKFKQLTQSDRIWKQRFQSDFSKSIKQHFLPVGQSFSKEVYQAFLNSGLVQQEQEIIRLLLLAYHHHPFEQFFETLDWNSQFFRRAYGCFDFGRDAPSSFHDVFIKIIGNDLPFIKSGLKKLVQFSQNKIENLEAAYKLYEQREVELNCLNEFIFDKILTYSINVIEGKVLEVGQTRTLTGYVRPVAEPDQPRKRVLAKGLLTRVTEQSIEHLWDKIPDVRSLDLSFNGLSFIPETINLLSHLKTLRLAHNRLTSIPSVLPPLKRLDVTSNLLSNLPHVILNLTTLEELYFGNFAPSGRDCICKDFIGRKTSGNQLSVLPPEITQLKKLRLLSLKSVGLTKISSDLLQLPELKIAILFHNEIQGVPPELLQSNQIQWRLEGNPIRDEPMSPESDKKQQQIANIIGWLNAKSFQEIDVEDISYLFTMDTPTIAQRANKILRWFGKIISNLGDSINLKPNICYLDAISYSYNSKDLDCSLGYLYQKKSFIKIHFLG